MIESLREYVNYIRERLGSRKKRENDQYLSRKKERERKKGVQTCLVWCSTVLFLVSQVMAACNEKRKRKEKKEKSVKNAKNSQTGNSKNR